MLKPYQIKGTVTLLLGGSASATAQRGAKVWAVNMSRYGYGALGSAEGIHFERSNSSGRYILDVANIVKPQASPATSTNTYANGDTVRVYCQLGRMFSWQDFTLDTKKNTHTIDFAFVRRSGLKDGLKDTKDSDGKYGFNNLRGLNKGLKDGLA